MKSIGSKLKSSQGISIIIAMVFMLICLFVGGVVLTSATVNAGRMKNVKRNEKFMDFRSAAILLADELRPADGRNLELEIIKTDHKKQNVKVSRLGEVKSKGEETTSSVIKFKLSHDPEKLTTFQRIVLESAMKVYQQKNPTPIPVMFERNGVLITELNYSYLTNSDVDNFYIDGQLKNSKHAFKIYCYRGKEGNKTDNEFDFFFKFNWPKNHEKYENWTEDEKKQPKIDVRMYSDSPVEKILPPVEKVVMITNKPNQDNDAVLHTDITTVRSIIWQGPKIMKGDAKA